MDGEGEEDGEEDGVGVLGTVYVKRARLCLSEGGEMCGLASCGEGSFRGVLDCW